MLVFVFYLFHQPPMLFNRAHAGDDRAKRAGWRVTRARDDVCAGLRALRKAGGRTDAAGEASRASARGAVLAANAELKGIRARAATLVRDVTGDQGYTNSSATCPAPDVNYVFPTFVTTQLPPGLVGLIIAAIFAAAMSTIAAELNSTRHIHGHRRVSAADSSSATDAHYLVAFDAGHGLLGRRRVRGGVRRRAGLGSLIEVVNRFGSFFYGSLLGVFVLALGFRRANGHGAFVGLIAGIAIVATVALHPATKSISFLWQNPIGVVVVVIVGLIVSAMTGGPTRDAPPQPASSRGQ